MIMPVVVTVVLCASSVNFATPRSASFGVPSASNMMFSGLMSRWITPCRCATSRASATCAAIDTASAIGKGPLFSRRSATLPPGT